MLRDKFLEHTKKGVLLVRKAISRRKFLKLTGASLLGTFFQWSSIHERAKAQDQPGPSDCLKIVSVRPERPHLVAPGSTTTFVVAVTNPSSIQVVATLSVQCPAVGWSARVCKADRLFQPVGQKGDMLSFDMAGNETLHFVVELSAELGQTDGQIGEAEIIVTNGGLLSGSVTVRGKVRSSPKIYFAVYDGLGREYVKLDRGGEYEQVDTNPLMPNVRRFMADSACLLEARSQLPSFTDPNHVAAITGSWPGTTGTICLRQYYGGRDKEGNPVKVHGDSRILRWGKDGEPVLSLFHVAKDPAMGGDSDALNAMILGKEWIGHYFRDLRRTVDVIAGGLIHPDYLPPPESYVLGDPPSDDNADQDRDGCNLKPQALFRMFPNPPFGAFGKQPDRAPDDRWVVEGALRIIAAEDPDVLYIQPALVDIAQHHTGAADRPKEWDHGSHPEVLWDDFNRYNPYANRDPVLDVVNEADATFGLLVETLQARGTYDESVLIFTSDHGQRTYRNKRLQYMQICRDAGIPEEAFEWVTSAAEGAYLWLSDPSYVDAIRSTLEGYSVYHPILRKGVHPFLVLDQEEMESGIDRVWGRIAQSGGPKRAELYSEWYIDYPVEDNSKPIWPDLIVFSLYRCQVAFSGPGIRLLVGGHGGVGWPQNIPLVIHGPGINRGVFDQQPVHLVDIVPTLYHLLGWTTPENVDGQVVSEILTVP